MCVLDSTCIFHHNGAESQGDITHSCFQTEDVKKYKYKLNAAIS